MKKILYSGVGSALLAGLMATPAAADVTVTASLTKTKDVFVVVDIAKDKTVLLTADVVVVPTSAAEALAIANVTNTGNIVSQSEQAGVPVPLSNYDIYRRAAINDSVTGNAGVVELNQDVGNMANQGNVLAFAAIFSTGLAGGDPAGTNTTYVEAEAWVDQVNTNNIVVHLEDPADVPVAPAVNPNGDVGNANVAATMANSINGNAGIVGVNQNAGNMPNQTNAVALAVGFGAVAALSEGALGQENAGNFVVEAGVKKVASVAGSVNGNTGVVHVNQSAGNMANQSNVFALAFVQGGP